MFNLTVVTGLWRSGSSMMMQILEAGGITPVRHYFNRDEFNERGYYEIDERQAGRVYGEITACQHPNSSVKVLLPFLKKNNLIDLADNVIFMQRDYDEIIHSTNRKFGRSPYKRGLQLLEKEAKEFLREKQIPVFFLNYNEVLEDPKRALQPIKFLLKEFDSACAAVDPELNKTRGKREIVF